MKITVLYRGQVKQAAGVSSEIIDLNEPCSVAELARRLGGERGDPIRNFLLTGDGALRSHILFVVGDEQVSPDQNLREGDVVTILPPMAGG